jgi:hypothetical protein
MWRVSVTPRSLSTPGKDPVPILQEAGWAPDPVWTCAENLAHIGIRSLDRPARSQLLTDWATRPTVGQIDNRLSVHVHRWQSPFVLRQRLPAVVVWHMEMIVHIIVVLINLICFSERGWLQLHLTYPYLNWRIIEDKCGHIYEHTRRALHFS